MIKLIFIKILILLHLVLVYYCWTKRSFFLTIGSVMETQNGSVDSAYVCGPSVFSMDASNNQQLQSVQYGLTDDEENPRPTCQKDDSEFKLPLEDNCKTLHTSTWETSFHCYYKLRDVRVVPRQNVGLYFIDFSLLLSENDTEDDELLENHSALEVDKPNKNAKLRTGLCYQLTSVITLWLRL